MKTSRPGRRQPQSLAKSQCFPAAATCKKIKEISLKSHVFHFPAPTASLQAPSSLSCAAQRQAALAFPVTYKNCRNGMECSGLQGWKRRCFPSCGCDSWKFKFGRTIISSKDPSPQSAQARSTNLHHYLSRYVESGGDPDDLQQGSA